MSSSRDEKVRPENLSKNDRGKYTKREEHLNQIQRVQVQGLTRAHATMEDYPKLEKFRAR